MLTVILEDFISQGLVIDAFVGEQHFLDGVIEHVQESPTGGEAMIDNVYKLISEEQDL